MKRKIYAAKAGDILKYIGKATDGATPWIIQIINPIAHIVSEEIDHITYPAICTYIDLRNNCKMNYYFDNLFDMLEWEKIG